jgi:hypothetical protein
VSAAVWTMTCADALGAVRWSAKTLAELGVVGLTRARVSQDADSVAFRLDGASFDSETTPAGYAVPQYGDLLSVYRDGVRWFYGKVTSLPRSGGGAEESIAVTAEGPTWWLSRCVLQQAWQGQTTTYNKGRLILFRSLAGARITVGEQLAAILAFAEAAGAPIDWNEDDLDGLAMYPPENEVLDVTCAEALRICLRWAPDATTWWDYAGAGAPVLRIARHATATAVSLAIPDTAERLSIVRRDDLAVPGIRLRYEKTNSADGDTWTTVVEDTAGDVAAFGALALTIDLQGVQSATVSQRIRTMALPAISGTTFWKQFCPWMNDARVTSLTISGSAATPTPLANLILEGSIQDWMKDDLDVDVVESVVTAKASYNVEVGGKVVAQLKDIALSARIVTTDGATKTYRTVVSSQAGEAIPVGLAAALYAALSIVHHEGSASFAAEDCRDDVHPGLVLNLTGCAAAWATMRAAIQRVDDDVDAGTTAIAFGPPGHLDSSDYIALLRPSRRRAPSARHTERTSGKAGDGNEVAISGAIPGFDGIAGPVLQCDAEVIGSGSQTIELKPGATGWAAYKPMVISSDGTVMKPDWLRAH